MPLRPVPWATSGGADGRGGAENLVELARADAYAGTNGATGIINPDDLKVTALPTPGAAVRIVQGTAVIESLYPGITGQSYIVQEQSYTDAPVAATGSSGGATKYVYIMIEDTQYKGQTPSNVETGPYNSYQVTTNLPTFTPYLLLAEIDQPKSTATITNAMITDRREVANPIIRVRNFARPRVTADEDDRSNYLNVRTSAGGEFFPGGAGFQNEASLVIPKNAVSMIIKPKWSSVEYKAVNAIGMFWIEFGDEYRPRTDPNPWPHNRQYEFGTQYFRFNAPAAGNAMRMDWSCSDTVTVPTKLRGRRCTFVFKAGLDDGAPLNSVGMDRYSGQGMEIIFSKEAANKDGFN